MMTVPSAARRSRPRGLLALAAALALVGPALAEAQPGPAAPGRSAAPRLPAVETWQLDNGLEVAFVAVPGSPAVSVQVWYRVGAVDDPAGKHGLARLFEQFMFAGSARVRPGDHRGFLEQVGGVVTASVSEDVSAYATTVPADRLDLALELEAERMRGLELTDVVVADAVAQAQAQLGQSAQSPLWRAYRRLLATAYVQHPYGPAAASVPAELETITTGDARAFYDAYYQPSNALVVVVGGVEPALVRGAVAARFAGLARGPAPIRPAADRPEPPQSARRLDELAGADNVVMLGFHIPAAASPEVAALQLAAQLLIGGKGSRLYGALVASGKASDLGGQLLVRREPGLFMLFARTASAGSDALEQAIARELAGLARTGPTAAELRRAKKQIAASVAGAAQSVTGLGNQLGIAWTLTGKPGGVADDLAALLAVDGAAVKRAVKRHLGPDQVSVVAGRGRGTP